MRDASVGFQCPDCVAEGARTTRQGRTAYGGRRPGNASLTSIVLIALNGLVWVAVLATGWTKSELIPRLALMPTGSCWSEAEPGSFYPGLGTERLCAQVPDGLWFGGVADGAYWQMLTSMFTHVEVWHIAFNMLALWMLGPYLEQTLGRLRFATLYVLSAIGGSVAAVLLVPVVGGWSTGAVGASGAVFGLFGAVLVVLRRLGRDARGIVGIILVNVALSFLPGIAWQAHLGGLVVGAALGAAYAYVPRERRRLVAVLAPALVGVALVGATLAVYGRYGFV